MYIKKKSLLGQILLNKLKKNHRGCKIWVKHVCTCVCTFVCKGVYMCVQTHACRKRDDRLID